MAPNAKLCAQGESNKTHHAITSRDGMSNRTTIIMYSYMRGGSSFSGEIFNQNPSVIYWLVQSVHAGGGGASETVVFDVTSALYCVRVDVYW